MNEYPEPNLAHMRRLTDDTGMIQHATFILPDRSTGYTTDDNARALIAALRISERYPESGALALAEVYLAFLRYAQMDSGWFHNYMDYTRRFVDDGGSEDCFGRALWACGFTLKSFVDEGFKATALDMLKRAIPHVSRLTFPRAKAFSILGLSCIPEEINAGLAETAKALVDELAVSLCGCFEKSSTTRWQWFEEKLTYSNAVMPMSLFAAFKATGKSKYLEVAERSLSFLTKTLWKKDHFQLVGNNGWYVKGRKPPLYDQQPVDAGCLVQAYTLAYIQTLNEDYYRYAHLAYEWYHGLNTNRIPVYDPKTGGCYDALTPHGVNMNMGAESLLSFLLAHASIRECQAVKEGAAA
ncbi:MAG TPA: glycosyltransferase [Clostridia bacterium]|nr:glycosyltransferase [Clostridia bacterium]